MGRSTEKIEKLIQEIESRPSINTEESIKIKMEKAVKFMKMISNIYMVLTFAMFINIYVCLMEGIYIMAVFSSAFFLFNLYHLFDSYFFIKVYTSKNLVFHKEEENGQKTNKTIQQSK